MAMDPVSSADRLILILRQRLAERAEAGAAAKRDASGLTAKTGGGLRSIHALAAAQGASERQLRRRFVQNILAGEFGKELINEAQFQQVVEQVTEAIEGDPQSAALLSRVIAELGAA